MKPVKTRSMNQQRQSTRNQRLSPNQMKQLAFLSAFLFLVAAMISLYLAWRDLQNQGNTEVLV
ncbi:hypothetical protein ACTHPF_23115 [Paenibacillus sp. SAF-054]|uniref:hypothetical protein n=1 Tax=unclassified Paenibacillus TaxID=185978 RepID=UPI003F7F779B